jgi:pseudouridine-5'-phosphate glycosidase
LNVVHTIDHNTARMPVVVERLVDPAMTDGAALAGDPGANDGIRHWLTILPEVAEALAVGRPVVALESTLISHGLPYPQNVEVARASEAAVREAGSVPATVAIRDGRVLVGLDPETLDALATAAPGSVRKAARPTLASALAAGGLAATTVSATMIAAHASGIAVLATGGIGGVHRGAIGGQKPTLDVSSDLAELARTPVAVVCAGPKAILDVPMTLEYLETRGVPVMAVGQAEMPGFYSRSSGIAAPLVVADETEAAALFTIHRSLGFESAVLLCAPVPVGDELPLAEARAAIDRAVSEADAAEIHGPALTPWLLARIATITAGASVRANTALIVNNASVAGRIAVALVAARRLGSTRSRRTATPGALHIPRP